MIEINTPGVDIDKIKDCIRKEVARYKAAGKEKIFEPDRAFELSPPPFDDTPDPPLTIDGCVNKEQLMQFHGQEFINKAYISILQREPDYQGNAIYLDKLHNGELTKIEILGRLRYSEEGRIKQVKINNLLLPFLLKTFFKIPVLGRGLRIISAIINLPVILQNIQRIENTAIARYELMDERDRMTAEGISKLGREIERLDSDITRNRSELEDEVSVVQADLLTVQADLLKLVKENKIALVDMQRRLQILLEEAKKGQKESDRPVNCSPASGNDNDLTHLYDALYLNFEERFRGPEAEIKDRLRVYLPYVQQAGERTGAAPVLDVGCGRGEWLGLLKENNITAKGLDFNDVMVNKCRDAGLAVVRSDAVAYLRGLESESLGMITGFHIVEHLPFTTMMALLDESLRVLKPGGMVIFETPNPENIMVGACSFYTDPSHINPIPPATLSFLVEDRGYVNIEVLRLHPNESVHVEDPLLNHYFTIGQDYAVIGCKE